MLKTVSALREGGLEMADGYDDCLYLMYVPFDNRLRTKVNIETFDKHMQARGHRFVVILEADEDEGLEGAHLLLGPTIANSPVDLEHALDLARTIVNREHISEEAYWEEMQPLIDGLWKKMSFSQRLEAIKLAGAEGSASALDEKPHEDVATVIWRELDD